MNEPSDETVREAIAAAGDPELSRLAAGDSAFVLRPADAGGERYALHHVILVDAPHPMSALLAVAPGEAVITSSRPDVVAGLLERDPGLRDPTTIWQLIRGGPLDGHLESAALVASGHYEFVVRDDATEALSRWRLALSPPGLERVAG